MAFSYRRFSIAVFLVVSVFFKSTRLSENYYCALKGTKLESVLVILVKGKLSTLSGQKHLSGTRKVKNKVDEMKTSPLVHQCVGKTSQQQY